MYWLTGSNARSSVDVPNGSLVPTAKEFDRQPTHASGGCGSPLRLGSVRVLHPLALRSVATRLGGETVAMWSSILGKSKSAPAKQGKSASKPEPSGPPPLTPEETKGNLSLLERKLNESMKCPAGKNHVFIRSLVTINGTTPPRIALKCQLRRDIGQKPEVFHDHIRDICCSDPSKCEAYQKFKGRYVQT